MNFVHIRKELATTCDSDDNLVPSALHIRQKSTIKKHKGLLNQQKESVYISILTF